ncbi:MAG: trypsin-like serine protease [Calditrichaeota bacterium]|nr:trypsin-like serine protease [Calditrichota bacterium]
MFKSWKFFVAIGIGLLAGILLKDYLPFGSSSDGQNIDTSLVTQANAQPVAGTDSITSHRQNALTRAVQMVTPAVVSINVTKIDRYVQHNPFFDDPFFRQFFPELFSDRIVEQPVKSIGSGFIISSDGYVVTNEHVVGEATEIIVAMSDGKEYPAQLVDKDRVSDIALLKIEGKFPYIRFGDSDQILIGEWAIALGNPFGLFIRNQPTVTVGVVSAVNRDFSPLEGRIYEDMIQTDAAINMGNSGGPLCNADGEVIGMNTFIFTGDPQSHGSVGIGFAIPSKRIQQVVEKLKFRRGKDKNVWIGMYVSNLNPYIARSLGYPSTRGVYVRRIDRHSPAEKAGVKLGDIIVEINGQAINTYMDAEAIILSLDLRVGDKMRIKVWRNGKILDIDLVLEEYPQ